MENTMNRRSFLKGVAAAGTGLAFAAGATGALADEAAATDEAASSDAEPSTDDLDRWLSPAAKAWRTPKEPVADDQIADGGSYDIVIVGGGQAGTWCARFAAMNGASVAVLEARAQDAFPMYIGGEVGTINSEKNVAEGAMQIDHEEFMNECFRRNAGRSNQRMLREFVEYSGPIFDWAIKDLDDDWMRANTHITDVPYADADLPSNENMVTDPSGYKFFTGTRISAPPTPPCPSGTGAPTS